MSPGFLYALVALIQGQVDRAPEPWSSERVRSMSPEEMTRQLFGELSPLLFPYSYLNDIYLRLGRLWQLSFYSVPRAGSTIGLCETDWVRVSFGPTGRSERSDAAAPVRPTQIQAGPVYFIGDLERTLRAGPRSAEEREAFNAACSEVDPRNRTRIIAHDPRDIVVGLRLLSAITEAAKAGRALAPVDCSPLVREGDKPLGEAECLAELAAVEPGQVVHTAPPRVTPSGVTRSIDTDERWLLLHFGPGDAGDTSAALRLSIPAVPQRIVLGRPPDPPLVF